MVRRLSIANAARYGVFPLLMGLAGWAYFLADAPGPAFTATFRMPAMNVSTWLLILLSLVGSLPVWLPGRVTALRNWLFSRIDGAACVTLPNAKIDADEAMAIYRHAHAGGKAAGSYLSDLFWYWLTPGPHLHQENMEPGVRYDLSKRTTRKLLALKPNLLFNLAGKHLDHHVARFPGRGWDQVSLTRWFMPMFAGFYYELVFGHEGTADELAILTAHADNFLGALKCNELRDMPVRHAATSVIAAALAKTPTERFQPLADIYSTEELALYLQANFFRAGIGQMSEALAHILLAVAHQPALQHRFSIEASPAAYSQSLMKETFRLFPLFGISHRILRGDISLKDGRVLSAGTVICLNHMAYNKEVYPDGSRFDPNRWYDKELDKIQILFGAKENRSCPAEGMVVNLVGFLLPKLLTTFTFAASGEHSRSLANFGPCYVIKRGKVLPQKILRLAIMRQVDNWRRVNLSLRQLIFGTYMLVEARHLALCQRFFASAASNSTDGSLEVNS